MRRKSLSAVALLLALAAAACGSTQSQSKAVAATPTATSTADAERDQTLPAVAEPAPEQMLLARQVGKLGVPVEVRYQFDVAPVRDQPMSVRLAFIPRVAGQNLRIEFPPAESVTVESADVRAREKVNAADVYRQSVVVTPRTEDAAEIRVLVSMDVEGGRYFGIFSVPVSVTR